VHKELQQNMLFWGKNVSEDQPIKETIPVGANLILSNVALMDANTNGFTTVLLKIKSHDATESKNFAIGCLNSACHQIKTDIFIEAGNALEFSVKGKGTVSMIGYYSLDDDQDDDDDDLNDSLLEQELHNFDDEDDEEDTDNEQEGDKQDNQKALKVAKDNAKHEKASVKAQPNTKIEQHKTVAHPKEGTAPKKTTLQKVAH